jgi:hypothetical protein
MRMTMLFLAPWHAIPSKSKILKRGAITGALGFGWQSEGQGKIATQCSTEFGIFLFVLIALGLLWPSKVRAVIGLAGTIAALEITRTESGNTNSNCKVDLGSGTQTTLNFGNTGFACDLDGVPTKTGKRLFPRAAKLP